jgi:hypothetical protein
MKASQPAASFGSSKPFISGEFSTISASDEFSDTFIDVLMDHIDDLMVEATAEFQDEALSDSDWSVYASGLAVEADAGDIRFYYSGAQEDEVLALEFGTPEQPPSPLIRATAANKARDIAKELSTRIAVEVPIA